MPALGFATLPEDIQYLICSYLWVASPPSLRALSEMNRRCYDVAVPFLYRGLTISITTRANLCKDIVELKESKAGNHYLHHTRQLQLTGQMLPPDTGNEKTAFLYRHKRFGPMNPSFTTPKLLEPDYRTSFIVGDAYSKREDALDDWMPLILIICEFRLLSDLIYECRSRFPPGLLDAIHQYHPTCRLHLHSFRFQSLHEDITDPNEHALVTSPCLHSLSVIYTRRDSLGIDDYNGDAATRTVTIAPNLKHVRMILYQPGNSWALHTSRNRPVAPWNGFVPPIDVFHKGSLISLSFYGCSNILTKERFNEWDKLTDLSKLREFAFSVFDPNVLMDMVEMSCFPSLKHLSITLQRPDDNEGFKIAAETFFDALKPLKSLTVVSSLHTELLTKICTRHGRTLCELALISRKDSFFNAAEPLQFTAADISMIGSSSNLSNLDITIKRSMSNTTETKCYEALGMIRTLKKLRIRLDCTNPRNPGPPSDDWDEFNKTAFDNQIYNGHVEYAIVNCAVDETLATSIWDVISENQALESLEVTPTGCGFGNIMPGDLLTISSNLMRSYLITASIPGDRAKLKVIELTKEKREKTDERMRKRDEEMIKKWGDEALRSPSFKVFERLWPLEVILNWREAWRSWPLQRGE